jgi:hypothetical protein
MENGISFNTPQESFIELKGQLYWENDIIDLEATLIISIAHIVAIRKDDDRALFYLVNGLRIKTEKLYRRVEESLKGKCNFIGSV